MSHFCDFADLDPGGKCGHDETPLDALVGIVILFFRNKEFFLQSAGETGAGMFLKLQTQTVLSKWLQERVGDFQPSVLGAETDSELTIFSLFLHRKNHFTINFDTAGGGGISGRQNWGGIGEGGARISV